MRGGGKGSDSEMPGCALFLLFFASVAFVVAGAVVLTAVLGT